jgi:hypothetical protein
MGSRCTHAVYKNDRNTGGEPMVLSRIFLT